MSKTTQLTASKQISLPLRLSPHITLHIQTTRLETSTRSFLTITNPSASGSLSCLGSFVYAMPNRFQPSDPLCTALYTVSGSIDFATRVAKALARKTGIPAYIGCSVEFSGVTVEEEVDAVRVALEGLISLSGGKESTTIEKDNERLKVGDTEKS